MSRKQFYMRKKMLNPAAIKGRLEMPGEPLIYSIKYPVGKRQYPENFFRNKQWFSLLKCHFRAYLKTTIPLVVVVRFYVSPPEYEDIKPADLRSEKVPATKAFELCDYLLSFLEMLHHSLINSYRQIVKIDMEKWYSDNPRTSLQFMTWENYNDLHNKNTAASASETGMAAEGKPSVHAKRQRDGRTRRLREGKPVWTDDAPLP